MLIQDSKNNAIIEKLFILEVVVSLAENGTNRQQNKASERRLRYMIMERKFLNVSKF